MWSGHLLRCAGKSTVCLCKTYSDFPVAAFPSVPVMCKNILFYKIGMPNFPFPFLLGLLFLQITELSLEQAGE